MLFLLQVVQDSRGLDGVQTALVDVKTDHMMVGGYSQPARQAPPHDLNIL